MRVKIEGENKSDDQLLQLGKKTLLQSEVELKPGTKFP